MSTALFVAAMRLAIFVLSLAGGLLMVAVNAQRFRHAHIRPVLPGIELLSARTRLLAVRVEVFVRIGFTALLFVSAYSVIETHLTSVAGGTRLPVVIAALLFVDIPLVYLWRLNRRLTKGCSCGKRE